MNRRSFLAHSCGWLAMGRVSVSLAQYRKVPNYAKSKEVISSVLISSDEKKLVVMTHDFHYVFDVPVALVQAIKGSFHPFTHATFSEFRVDSSGSTTGTVTLRVSGAPREDLESAVRAGFSRSPRGAWFTTELHGERYNAGDVQVGSQYQLNEPYEIEVETENGYSWRASPLASLGGSLALGLVILVSLPVAAGCALGKAAGACK